MQSQSWSTKHSPKQLLERVLEESGVLKGLFGCTHPILEAKKGQHQSLPAGCRFHCPCGSPSQYLCGFLWPQRQKAEPLSGCRGWLRNLITPSMFHPSAATMATHSLTSFWCWGILSDFSLSWLYPAEIWDTSFWLEHPGTFGCWSSPESPGDFPPRGWEWLFLFLAEGKVCLSPVLDRTVLGFLADLVSWGCRFSSSTCPVAAPTAPVPSVSVKARLNYFLQ